MRKIGSSLSIVYLLDSFEDDDAVHLLMELCKVNPKPQTLNPELYTPVQLQTLGPELFIPNPQQSAPAS